MYKMYFETLPMRAQGLFSCESTHQFSRIRVWWNSFKTQPSKSNPEDKCTD